MKYFINTLGKEDIKFACYHLARDGGHKLDKRTWQAKELLERIRYNALNPCRKYNPSFRMLRMKDINRLFTTDNLNLN